MATDFKQYFQVVIDHLLTDAPTERNGHKLRYGSRGSLAIDMQECTWYSHEEEIGGGTLDFIAWKQGGSIADAIRWLEDHGIKPREELPPKSQQVKRKIVATYDYVDLDGVLQYQVLRYEPKDFRQRAGDGSWSVKGIAPLLYKLPELTANTNAPVFVVEGEKDVIALEKLGFVATCNSGGARKFPAECAEYLRGRNVIILPDNDDAGQQHAEHVAYLLQGIAERIRCVRLPGLPNKGDVCDWIAAGGDRQRLIDLCKSADDWKPTTSTITAANETLPSVFNQNLADYYTPLPLCNSKGKPLKHIANLEEITRRLGIVIRYNVIRKEEEILIPNKSFSVDNEANASFAWLVSECSRFDYATDKVGDFLTYISDQNLYNPVAQWVLSKPWDGVTRLPDLFRTIVTNDQSADWLKDALIRRWLVSAVAAAFDPNGVSAGGILTLQGAQNLGKTKWLKMLAPDHLGLIKDGMILRPDDKDSVKQICSFWIVELGELDATFRKSDVAALKAFITNRSDVLRRAYAKKESHFARRTVFFASVNPTEFLHDKTGNRRYWTIPCKEIDHSHTIDMQQLWAEVKETLFDKGFSHYLNQQELEALNDHNESHMAIDPIEERIMSGLSWDDPTTAWRWASATDILVEVGIDRPSRSDAMSAAEVIRKMNDGQVRRSGRGRLLLCPRPLPRHY